jgi:putative Holliday junction resolvase
MRYIGIDFGTKRVGVAVSDEEGKIAFPHAVLTNDRNLTTALVSLAREKNVGAFVVGDSRDLSGKPNPIARAIEEFKKEIDQATGLPVFAEPEFWTSLQAERVQGKTDKTDASAAALILQSFLDRRMGGPARTRQNDSVGLATDIIQSGGV